MPVSRIIAMNVLSRINEILGKCLIDTIILYLENADTEIIYTYNLMF